MSLRRRSVVLGLAGGALLAGPSSAAPARVLRVTIVDMAFRPAVLRARVGDTVVWTNADMFRHTATAKDGGFDIDLPVKASGRTTLRKRGVIDYACAYHSGMQGKIVVE